MRVGRIIALVIGSLLSLMAFGMLLGAAAIGIMTAVERDDDGYFEVLLDRIESDGVAVASSDTRFSSDVGPPDWVLDLLDVDVRLDVAAVDEAEIFVGIGRSADVDAYLAEAAHDVVVEVDGDRVVLRSREGGTDIEPPGEQDFWDVQDEAAGTATVEWEAQSGRWTAVVMNADGSPGISADVEVGAKSGLLAVIAFSLLGIGLLILIAGVGLIVFGAVGLRRPSDEAPTGPAGPAGGQGVIAETPAPAAAPPSEPAEPVALEGRLDPDVSRWQWLVKWFLAIPHMIILVFLWIAFFVVWVIVFFAILFTARYPRGLFDFSVGVLRWTWRVWFYAFTGGLGTDAYPPFSLEDDPDYPARLDIAYPERLSRGLVLVKWWLLAIPHYLILSVFWGSSSTVWVETGDGSETVIRTGAAGLLAVLTLIAVIALLFRGRHLRGLFDFIVGLNRWIFRVWAYVFLMTDRYPPFRLDQGEQEPDAASPSVLEPGPSTPATPGATGWGPPGTSGR